LSRLTGAAYSTSGGSLDRSVELNITIDSEKITSDSAIYTEDDSGAQLIAKVEFCVRLSLYTPDIGIEVNFLETIVTLFVDLTDGFDIADVNVAPLIKETKTATQVYEVEAYQCGTNNAELSQLQKDSTRNQGSVIKVCVRPDATARDDGIFMREVESFDFTRDNNADGNADVTQPAIANSLPSTNGLTSMDCKAGYLVCNFETILFAQFYTSAGIVAGSGIASMQFGGSARRLRSAESRSLEEEAAATAEFELNFETLPVADTTGASGAVGSSGVLGMSVVALMGVAALL
jgi:hypothetical protein